MTFDGADRHTTPAAASTDASAALAGGGVRSLTGARYAVQRKAAAAAAEPAPTAALGRFVVDDGPVGPGQMLRADFLDQASSAARQATQQDLGPLAALGSPYLDQVLARLHAPGAAVEAMIADLVPAADGAGSAAELVPLLVQHVRDESRARDTGRPATGTAHVADRESPSGGSPGGPPSPAAAGPHDEIEARPVMTPAIEALIEHVGQLVEDSLQEKVVAQANARLDAPSRERAQERRAGNAPDLTGVGATDTLDAIAASFRPLEEDWPTLDQQGRRDRMKDAGNVGLAAAAVPPMVSAIKSPKQAKASFNFHDWELWINGKVTEAMTLDTPTAGELCSAVAHETRHAEQYFLSARFAAAGGADAAKIATDLQIPGAIAVEAQKRGLAGAPAQVVDLATEMYGATVIDRTAHRKINGLTGYEELKRARDSAKQASDRLRDWPSSSNARLAREACAQLEYAVREVERLHVMYRGMPHEADSYEVGEAAQLAYETSR